MGDRKDKAAIKEGAVKSESDLSEGTGNKVVESTSSAGSESKVIDIKEQIDGDHILLQVTLESSENNGISNEVIVSTSGGQNVREGKKIPFGDVADHVHSISPVKAVLSSGDHEPLLSDDETPKVLTTLEPPKKANVVSKKLPADHEAEDHMIEEHIIEEHVLLEEDELDGEDHIIEEEDDADIEHELEAFDNSPQDPSKAYICEIARKQLEKIAGKQIQARPKHVMAPSDGESSKSKSQEIRILNKDSAKATNGRSVQRAKSSTGAVMLTSQIISKKELEREVIERKLKKAEESSVETELAKKIQSRFGKTMGNIVKVGKDIPASKSPLDLLKGKDVTMTLIASKAAPKESDNQAGPYKALIDSDWAREIAQKQINNLPRKPKGRRPKPKTTSDKPGEKSASTEDLVNLLMSDWSDNEDRKETSDEITDELKSIKKEPNFVLVVEEPAPMKRSRVIKKKKIWDPDVPESHTSYASLVQTPTKRPLVSTTVQQRKAIQESAKEMSMSPSVSTVSTPSFSKKKKLSEIDRLLGDEGAVNMIYSLERENNNADVPEIKTKPNRNSMISIQKERKDLVARTKTVRQAVLKQTTEATNPRRVKRDSTSLTPPSLKKEATGSKRKQNMASETWDFVYSQQRANEESMIIRRRSNSSYSSTTSPRRLSIDQPLVQAIAAGKTPSVSSREEFDEKITPSPKKLKGKVAGAGASFEFAKPDSKASPKERVPVDHVIVTDLKGSISRLINKTLGTTNDTDTSTGRRSTRSTEVTVPAAKEQQTIKLRISERKLANAEYKELNIRRYDNFVQLIMSPNSGKLKNVFTIQLMGEVKTALMNLKADDKCRAVLLTSSGNAFCLGVDISSLLQNTIEKRKQAAHELGNAVQSFLMALASFTKPLIAGIHGSTVGIGVTMLPLFDQVLSSDKATFQTPYAKIGQLPEGNCVLNLTRKVSQSAMAELFFSCRPITSTVAFENGLVSKLLWPDTFQEELLQHVKSISSLSGQTFEAIKIQSQKRLLSALDTALSDETKILVQHWISAECQENFKQYLIREEW